MSYPWRGFSATTASTAHSLSASVAVRGIGETCHIGLLGSLRLVEVIVRRAIPTVLATALVLAACGADGGPERAELVVFAAASLTDAFEEVTDAFEDANPGTSVDLNFAASSALREQILEGAPADVFASANDSNMDVVVDSGEADDSQAFAQNHLEIVVPAGNEAGV